MRIFAVVSFILYVPPRYDLSVDPANPLYINPDNVKAARGGFTTMRFITENGQWRCAQCNRTWQRKLKMTTCVFAVR